jgi:hypothetical protein
LTCQLEEAIDPDWQAASQTFTTTVREEQFRQQYFYQVDLAILQATAQQVRP